MQGGCKKECRRPLEHAHAVNILHPPSTARCTRRLHVYNFMSWKPDAEKERSFYQGCGSGVSALPSRLSLHPYQARHVMCIHDCMLSNQPRRDGARDRILLRYERALHCSIHPSWPTGHQSSPTPTSGPQPDGIGRATCSCI